MNAPSAAAAFWRAPTLALMALVRGYRFFLSPWLGSSCRFEPTCSAYSLQALERHGAVLGTCLTVHRLLRCGPWCAGGHDPVPHELRTAGLFTRLFAAAPRPDPSQNPSTEKTSP
jgi:putative membrane protein insertion efficiency factor